MAEGEDNSDGKTIFGLFLFMNIRQGANLNDSPKYFINFSSCRRVQHHNVPYYHCTGTAQSSRGGCSRPVHKIVYLAVKRGNILVIFLLLKIISKAINVNHF